MDNFFTLINPESLGRPRGYSNGLLTTPGVRQTLYGRVTDVDRNEIRVKTSDESFEVKLKDPKSAGIRKGDNVQIDLTFTPTSPSALPRR